MRVVSVVGNRPQFVKAAPLHLALAPLADVVLVDTGQHYDHGLAGIFYDELGIAPPAHRLEVGSGTHAETTGRVLERIEPVLAAEAPDWVVVYGDTNSTLAAALAAAKLGLPDRARRGRAAVVRPVDAGGGQPGAGRRGRRPAAVPVRRGGAQPRGRGRHRAACTWWAT